MFISFHTKLYGYEISKDADCRQDLMAVMGNLINETGCKTIIINGVKDHVHVFFVMQSISKAMQNVKVKSSKWVKER
jgi:putative transposase